MSDARCIRGVRPVYGRWTAALNEIKGLEISA